MLRFTTPVARFACADQVRVSLTCIRGKAEREGATYDEEYCQTVIIDCIEQFGWITLWWHRVRIRFVVLLRHLARLLWFGKREEDNVENDSVGQDECHVVGCDPEDVWYIHLLRTQRRDSCR